MGSLGPSWDAEAFSPTQAWGQSSLLTLCIFQGKQHTQGTLDSGPARQPTPANPSQGLLLHLQALKPLQAHCPRGSALRGLGGVGGGSHLSFTSCSVSLSEINVPPTNDSWAPTLLASGLVGSHGLGSSGASKSKKQNAIQHFEGCDGEIKAMAAPGRELLTHTR